MSKQQTITLDQAHRTSQSRQPDRAPLRLEELLTLIKSANERGYSVKSARDMKSLYDAISSDLYTVWYAIGHEVPIYADNIPELIKFTGWHHHGSPPLANNASFDLAAAV